MAVVSYLQDLEAELNLMDSDYFKCSEEYMLYGQITFLMSRFDCFLEMYAERIQSTAFPKEHLYVRKSRLFCFQIELATKLHLVFVEEHKI